MFCGIEDERSTRPQQFARTGCDNGAVFQLNGCSRTIPHLLAITRSHCGAAIFGGEFGLLHDERNFVHLLLIVSSQSVAIQRIIVATDDFVAGCITTHILRAHAETEHVHSHVGRRLIRILTINTLKERIEHGEYLNVAIVVHGYVTIGFKMERVNHVHVIEISRCSLIGNVHRMLQRKVPHGESFKLGISGFHATLVLMIELAETNCHLPAAGTGSRYHHQRA